MNKLLVITVLVALLALNAESFRMPRQAEEERGTLTRFTDGVKYYYNEAVNTASGYLESIKGLKIEEKATNFYKDVAEVVSTYGGIAQDQAYHILYGQQ
uniref:Apolipoprotein C-II n=1 Tax=Sphaeramia orbicularis TaxID=375764 RepID=A0A672YEN0_9TELE